MSLPADYLERTYAGVLGKLIGVYLGRPFEGWTYQRILRELGPIEYYVHERLGEPLVVTDDDVAGTFTFIRALEDHGVSADLSAEQIGKVWLNYLIEHRAILWWGGSGNSTEHTAWLNLKYGVPAPASGSVATNGATVAEQIGAQIFIDGWAMVAPGQPALAAKLARQAGLVSHDGESVYAAMLWAAMEAEAYRSKDIDHLLDTGLSMIPGESLIASLIADLRRWHREHDQWEQTRQAIEDSYGYDRYPGNCHVVPNHALMIMAMLYAPHDFQRAQMIVNTSGWDTDCNAGNVGCLSGLMLGLDGIDAGPDWRGPMADRMLISSADGGNAINDAVHTANYLCELGRQLAGLEPVSAPKHGARFHFSQRGSRQGFTSIAGEKLTTASLSNVAFENSRALAIDIDGLTPGTASLVTTPVFASPEVRAMRTYELMACPLVYPGQRLRARVIADSANTVPLKVAMQLRYYDGDDALTALGADPTTLSPGADQLLEWTVPELGGCAIAEVGLCVSGDEGPVGGKLILDWLDFDGTPRMRLNRPPGQGQFWHSAWVNGASMLSKHFPQSFRLSQDRGEGIIIHGTRQWIDYQASADVMLHLGHYGGLAIRVQGLRRYYCARLSRDGRFELIRVRDDDHWIMAECSFPVALETPCKLAISVHGTTLEARADDVVLQAQDTRDDALANGGIGLLVYEGAFSANQIDVGPIDTAGL